MSTIANWLHHFTENRPMRLIEIGDAPYLERYHVAKIGPLRIWLHRFVRDDMERHVHDHPWSALSVILSGGYTEQIDDARSGWRNVKAFGLNWIPAQKQHRIIAVTPGTWSLMIVGPRTGRGWFFYDVDDSGEIVKTPGFSGNPEWHLTAKTRRQIYADRIL